VREACACCGVCCCVLWMLWICLVIAWRCSRVCSDDERTKTFAWGRGVGQTDTSPVWWRGAHISNQTRTQFRFIRTVRFAVCDIRTMFHVKHFAYHTVSGVSYFANTGSVGGFSLERCSTLVLFKKEEKANE
jgi:hypothetical protein